MVKSTTYDSSSSRFSYWSDGDHRKVNTIYDVRSPHARLHKNGSRKRIISRKNHHQTCFTECLDACDYNYGNLVSRYIDRNVCHRTNFSYSWDGYIIRRKYQSAGLSCHHGHDSIFSLRSYLHDFSTRYRLWTTLS